MKALASMLMVPVVLGLLGVSCRGRPRGDLLPASGGAASPADAEGSDEGMWLFNDFPSDRVAERHGFSPSQAWLDHVRLSSVRLALGCSGSFVSDRGLVMTNHHCAHACIEQLSTANKDYIASGFYAKTEQEEVKCPAMAIDQLVEITPATDQVRAATRGLTGRAFTDAQRAEIARIEKACATSADVRCEVVNLYHGGRYDLYKYRRFQDVRLVFAPEFSIAFFGGDPDNFEFPRYALDVSFLRVYEGGRPAVTPDHFAWNPSGPSEGDLTFVSGNPGSTSRELTVAELETVRDVTAPSRLYRLAELRGALEEFRRRGAEEARISGAKLFAVENSFKALRGREAALLDKGFFAQITAREAELRAAIEREPALKAEVGDAWETIAAAQAKARALYERYSLIEGGAGFQSDLFNLARTLVRAAVELPKANEDRLPEFGDSRLPAVKLALSSTAPIHEDLEILLLSLSLSQMRATLGADDPTVKKALGTRSPLEVATEAVRGSKLADPKVREALFAGGAAAVDASRDPMIDLARRVDGDARAVRARYESEVEGPVKQSSERIAKARFAVFGTSRAPDATFTLRLSFGQVKGWMEGDTMISPFTTFEGAFRRATGVAPFALPESWIQAKPRLNLATPLNFCTTNDIVGGNSGSPVLDKDARVVGLIFDGNIHSLSGDYAYDAATNRAVAVDSAGMLEALDKIYDARRVRDELMMGE